MSGIRVFVTFPELGMQPSDVDLGNAELVETKYRTWELAAGSDSLAQVFDLVSRKRLTSAYVSTGPMPRDRPWVAREWQGKVVTDMQLADEIRRRFVDWTPNLLVELRLATFEPRYAEPREAMRTKYREHLNNQAPLFIEADVDDVLANPTDWFGEYAGPEAAGWVTLLSAAMLGGGDRKILLGNLASLGLQRNDGADSLWSAVRSGSVSAKAIGFSLGEEDWHEKAGFQLPRNKFTSEIFERSNTDYAVAVEIDATVDPKVIIGSGTVFEQLTPGHTQNLSVAQEWHDTINPNQILGIVLPAYCLNRNMSPPSGQPMQLTPLAFAGISVDQGAVWRDIAERRQRGGRL